MGSWKEIQGNGQGVKRLSSASTLARRSWKTTDRSMTAIRSALTTEVVFKPV